MAAVAVAADAAGYQDLTESTLERATRIGLVLAELVLDALLVTGLVPVAAATGGRHHFLAADDHCGAVV